MRKTLIALVVTLSLAIPAGVALAASDPTAAQYHHDPAAAVVRSADHVAGLPVTGLDLLTLAIVAILMTGFGIVLVKTSRPSER